MPVTREQSYAALASLHPAPIFLQCYQQETLPDMMELFFRPPEVFFISPEIQTQYTQDVLYRFWTKAVLTPLSCCTRTAVNCFVSA